MNDAVKFRLEDLKLVLEAIRTVRPEFEAKVRETGELTSKEVNEVFSRLLSLYSVLGSSAQTYIDALTVATQRVGNVERIRPGIERRRNKRGKAA